MNRCKIGIIHATNLTIMNTMTYNFNEKNHPQNFKAEGDEYIKNLKNDSTFCRKFFFDTEITDENGKKKKRLCQIDPLRSKMIFEFLKDYGIEIKPKDFSTVIYQTLWADGTWKPLDSFEGHSSFFAWLRKVARNAITEWLVDEHQIDEARFRSAGNTRLALLSLTPIKCRMVIDNLMIGSKYHKLLTLIYVDRLQQEAIMDCLHICNDEYKKNKKAGENKLKDALLRSVEYTEENILRDKKKHVVTVSSEFVADLSEWYKEKTGANPLTDVLGTNLTDEEVRVKTVEFLYDFSAKLKWSDQDRYIWCRRFIINVDPESLANELGHNRGWIDTRYSRLNRKFESAIKKWWMTNAS